MYIAFFYPARTASPIRESGLCAQGVPLMLHSGILNHFNL